MTNELRTWQSEHGVVVHGVPKASTVRLRVVATVASADSGGTGPPPVIGPWLEVETWDLEIGNDDGSELDPEGQKRGRCSESACAGFANAELQDPFVATKLMPLCFRCGLHFSKHEVAPVPLKAAADVRLDVGGSGGDGSGSHGSPVSTRSAEGSKTPSTSPHHVRALWAIASQCRGDEIAADGLLSCLQSLTACLPCVPAKVTSK